ncbi:hypothetical protein K4F52_005711 [Lecanicillium sp. MT-2017a]|nr:hypothetical protein K4F52_005711 [Lecanicillium sp. MT-2017a]
MKVSIGSVVALLAGVSAAGKWRNSDIAARDGKTDMEAKTNLKFAEASMATETLISQPIIGKQQSINNFINTLTFSDIKQILGDDYGYPFCFYFYDIDSGSNTGSLCGYFTTNSEVKFGDGTRLPYGANPPRISKQPSVAPQVVTVTASGSQSTRIINAGKVTKDDLRELLGADYGKPFRIIINGGSVSGTFDGSGNVIFDPSSKIPSAGNGNDGGSPTTKPPAPTNAPDSNTGSVTLGGNSDEIKDQLNHLSYDYVLNAVGGKYGPFYITFRSEDGTLEGYIKGEIYEGGSYSYKWAYTYKSR